MQIIQVAFVGMIGAGRHESFSPYFHSPFLAESCQISIPLNMKKSFNISIEWAGNEIQIKIKMFTVCANYIIGQHQMFTFISIQEFK